MAAPVEAGRVGRPHGLDGSFHVTRPLEGVFVAGMPMLVAGVEREVERLAGTAEKPIIRLAGCTSRGDAEALRGEPLLISRDAAPLEADEFWADDLVGLRVVDGEREVGEVSRVLALPSCEVLVVGELLVPLVDDAVRGIDVAAGVVDVDLGFLGEG